MVLFDVERYAIKGGNEPTEPFTEGYNNLIKELPVEDQQGAKQFFTYQDDIDNENAIRYGGSKIQALFKKHKPKSRKMRGGDVDKLFDISEDGVQNFN